MTSPHANPGSGNGQTTVSGRPVGADDPVTLTLVDGPAAAGWVHSAVGSSTTGRTPNNGGPL